MSKAELAKELLRKAKEAGCVPTKEGEWVVFRPPLPAELLLDASKLGNEIAELVGS